MESHLHPMLVHFPIALLFVSVALDAYGRLTDSKTFAPAAYLLLALGVGSGILALIAGNFAEEVAEEAGVPESLIESHETIATVTLAIFGALLLYRFVRRYMDQPDLDRAYLVAAFLGLGSLAATGYLGGQLVYQHGAGVDPTALEARAIATAELGEDD